MNMHRRNLLKGMAAVIAVQPDFLSRFPAIAARLPGAPRPARRCCMAERGELAEAQRGRRRQSDRGCTRRSRLRGGSEGGRVRATRREHPQSLLSRRPARRHAGLRLARCLDAGAERLCGEGAQRGRRGRGGQFRARQQSAPRRQGRRPQLSGHVERAGLAADLDARDERGDAARCLRAQGCEGKARQSPAVTAGAGTVWIDLYNAVTSEAGRYVQGGGCTDVGVAGLVQSGGFGSFSKGFGTAAAGLLEAEIVTADGEVRIANAYTNPDLFWALKGGGGGSWGVVTRLTLRTHDLPDIFGAAWGTIKAQSDEAFRADRALLRLLRRQSPQSALGRAGRLAPDNMLEISMVCQGLDTAQVEGGLAAFFDWVAASPQDFIIAAATGRALGAALVGRRGQSLHDPRQRPGAPEYHGWWKGDQEQVGAFLHGYRIAVAARVFAAGPGQRQRLVDALFAASRYKKVELHFNKGLAGARRRRRSRPRKTRRPIRP